MNSMKWLGGVSGFKKNEMGLQILVCKLARGGGSLKGEGRWYI
ncbi:MULTISPECIES: hypothetical protein [unclassified Bartonella]